MILLTTNKVDESLSMAKNRIKLSEVDARKILSLLAIRLGYHGWKMVPDWRRPDYKVLLFVESEDDYANPEICKLENGQVFTQLFNMADSIVHVVKYIFKLRHCIVIMGIHDGERHTWNTVIKDEDTLERLVIESALLDAND